MAAVIVPSSTTLPAHAPAGIRPRPTLRVIDGGRSPSSRARRRVFRRRRIGALVVMGLVAVVGWLAVVGATSLLDPPDPVPSSAATAAGSPAAAEAYTVQPGDTLWAIAARLAPDHDPRPIVDELADRAGSPVLQAGQRIDVRGLGR